MATLVPHYRCDSTSMLPMGNALPAYLKDTKLLFAWELLDRAGNNTHRYIAQSHIEVVL
jgi:hypothetical protein